MTDNQDTHGPERGTDLPVIVYNSTQPNLQQLIN